ncbi:hypothetical protein GGR28_003632 [Lewinella aquimaris]|uniref:CHAT domain-containing protein n=1 Tax=Neolewinella aquimaris TaxID=1835722 RepID=A0A840E750_9BACT|nr:CHAT domain-containing protein [Neolewinella aquimaris]MBB4080991.1 hypothetical protein [Neolewinella aquimaris]
MKWYNFFILAALFQIGLLYACQPDGAEACNSPRELAVPTGLTERLTEQVSWLNGIHRHYEGDIMAQLPVDTLKRLGRIADSLDNHPDPRLTIYYARTRRLQAIDLQNRLAWDSSTVVMGASAEKLEREVAPSPERDYELAYHYNLLGIAYDITFRPTPAIAFTRKSLDLNLANGYRVDALKDHLNLSSIYSRFNRPDLRNDELAAAYRLMESSMNCLQTNNDTSTVAGFRYLNARNAYFNARTALYQGDTVRALALATRANNELAETFTAVRRLGLEGEERYLMLMNELALRLGSDFYFEPELSSLGSQSAHWVSELSMPESSVFYVMALALRVQRMLIDARTRGECGWISSPEYATVLRYLEETTVEESIPGLRQYRVLLPRTLALLQRDCGRLLRDTQLLRMAREHAEIAVNDYERFVAQVEMEPHLEILGGNYREYYSDAMSVIGSVGATASDTLGFNEQLFSLSDRAKSMVLRLAYEKRQNRFAHGQEYQRLQQREQEMVRALRAAAGAGDADQTIRSSLRIIAYYDSLRSQSTGPARQLYTDMRYFDRLTSAEVQQRLLDRETAAIDYAYARGEIFISVIAPAAKTQFRVPVTAELNAAIGEISRGEASGYDKLRQAEVIFRHLVAGPLDWLAREGGLNTVLVVRDKALAGIDFSILPVGPVVDHLSWTRHQLVIDRVNVVYGYSLSTLLSGRDLRESRQKTEQRWGVFAATGEFTVGGRKISPLDELGGAIRDFASTYYSGGNDRVVHRATDREVIEEYGDSRYVMLAAHGHSDEILPERYYLQFYPDSSGKQGRLTTQDIYDTDLKADLVLSVNCESGRGTAFTNEGEKSISRALLFAGATAVIGGNDLLQDNVYPEVLDLFHRYWIVDRYPAARALRMAKLTYRSCNFDQDPARWASLVYYGDPNISYSAETALSSR